jgi:hypothetical protein
MASFTSIGSRVFLILPLLHVGPCRQFLSKLDEAPCLGSDPDEPESETFTSEQPLSGPATGLVIISTPTGRFVYWPDRKPADLTDENSRYVAYLDSLPF